MTQNILENIGSYKSEITISQVIRFFNGFGMSFTKTMIQHYVRVGILPSPLRKRYYVKSHIIRLSMIYELKDIYPLPEIGRLFNLYIKTGSESEMVDMYNEYRMLCDKHYSLAKDDNPLSLMTQTVVAKKIVKNMMDNEDL